MARYVINNENGRIYLGSGNVEMHLIFCSFAWKHLLAVRREFNCVSDVCRLDFFMLFVFPLSLTLKFPFLLLKMPVRIHFHTIYSK